METYIRARVDEDLKRVFEQACEDDGLTASLVLRQLMKEYVKNHQQLDLLNVSKKVKKA